MSPRHPLRHRLHDVAPLLGEELGRIAALESRATHVPRGTALVEQGEPYARAGALADGWAVKLRYLSDGRRQIVDFLMPGSLIGPQSVLFGTADHTVVTLVDANVTAVSPDAWTEMLLDAPALGAALAWLQQCDDAVVAERLASLGQRSARERIAHLLLELWMRGRIVGLFETPYLEMPITQAMLGDALGLSTVHVNRSMQWLRRDGLIEQERGGVYLKDIDGLRRAAVFEDDYLHDRRPSGPGWSRMARGPEMATAPSGRPDGAA